MIGRFAQGSRYQRHASTLTKASHEVHSGIDDSPGQIAAKRGDQHGPDLQTVRCCDADRARNGEGHYQAKQDFGNPFDWFKHPVGQPHKTPRLKGDIVIVTIAIIFRRFPPRTLG